MRQRQTHTFQIENASVFKQKLLSIYKEEKYVVYLDSNHTDQKYNSYSSLVGLGAIDSIQCNHGSAFLQLEEFKKEYQDWMFGFFGYDLKNELENLKSNHIDLLEFPDLFFFVPELVFDISKNEIKLYSFITSQQAADQLIDKINRFQISSEKTVFKKSTLTAQDSKEEYLKKAQTFLDHIHRGDIYEANFCTHFYANDVHLNTQKAFNKLNEISMPPFAVYARFDNFYAISASPERYLKKTDDKLISQPIKGTAKRSVHILEDDQLKKQLLNDPKERSENVMIVDLVRNDLSKTAVKGSVAVEELFGIYTFKQVHQMISTIVSQLDPNFTVLDSIKSTFPMGSMTGAPKISAMKIIEQSESFKRGLYSGAIGYFTPQDDFDFNVIIRTILYNENKKALSFSVGSAITAAAIPEKEYEECFLKAKALIEVLNHQGISFD